MVKACLSCAGQRLDGRCQLGHELGIDEDVGDADLLASAP